MASDERVPPPAGGVAVGRPAIELAFHHVGIGTADFEAAIATYQRLGHRLDVEVDDPVLNARIALLACPDGRGPWLEIVAPLSPGGPLSALLARRVLPAPYHTCYAARKLDEAAAALSDAGFRPLGEARPALAFDNAPVLFLYSPAVGLVELLQSPPPRFGGAVRSSGLV